MKPTGKRVQICTHFIKETNQKRKKLERDFFHFVLHLLLLCTLLVLYYFFITLVPKKKLCHFYPPPPPPPPPSNCSNLPIISFWRNFHPPTPIPDYSVLECKRCSRLFIVDGSMYNVRVSKFTLNCSVV